nr:hypothetical protein [Tanacetum cinerariifolium]
MFFGNVREIIKNKILKVMPFIKGKLSARYLGVPLLSKRLYVNDCSMLVDKVKKMILDWKNKSLSFAGRQAHPFTCWLYAGILVLYVYLSITISNEVERLMRVFLWNYGDFKKGKAKIKWVDVCKPKVEGGLGKKDKVLWKTVSGRLKDFSVNTVWNDLRVCSDIVPWATLVWFNQCIPRYAFMVWLAIHGRLMTQYLMGIWEKNGDMRCVFCKNVPDSHDHLFFECELSKKVWDCLKCMVRMDHALDRWREMSECSKIKPGKKDKVLWKTVSGRLKDFSVNTVWNDLRVCSDIVPWAKLVWFNQCIPRYAFMVWLAIHGRLMTQYLMGIWEKNGDMRCVFCKNVPDSHDHLFFECELSKKVWDCLKCMVRMDHALDRWSQVKEFMPPNPLVDEFCILTKMTSAEDLCSTSFDDTKVKVMKGKHRKAHRSIKISTPGSARAGSVLRRLRSDKIAGKARVRA